MAQFWKETAFQCKRLHENACRMVWDDTPNFALSENSIAQLGGMKAFEAMAV